MRSWSVGLAAAALVAAPMGAWAQESAAPACPDGVVLPDEFSGWAEPAPGKATPGAYDLSVVRVELWRAVDATLAPGESVAFVVEPSRWPDPGTYAGMFGFEAHADGVYRVALSAGAWIDVVAGDKLVESVSFGHGPDCSGIGKIVDFPLKAGEHVLELSGSPDAQVTVLITYRRD